MLGQNLLTVLVVVFFIFAAIVLIKDFMDWWD